MITELQKLEVRAMFLNGKHPRDIAAALDLKLNAVKYQVDKIPKTGSGLAEESEELDQENYKGWAEFWKDRYLTAHAMLIEADVIK